MLRCNLHNAHVAQLRLFLHLAAIHLPQHRSGCLMRKMNITSPWVVATIALLAQ